MNTLKYYGKIYIMLLAQYLKIRMQYRADFFISLFGIIISNIAGIVSFWVIFQSVKEINGWHYYELILMYAMSLLVLIPQELFFNNIWNLRLYLLQGTFIKFYFRPLNMMFYYMSELFDAKGLGQLTVGIIALVYSSVNLGSHWTVAKIILLLVVIFSASLIMISLMIIAASVAFWIINSNPMLQLIANLRDYSRYPINIYSNAMRFIFTFIIPIGFVAFYPSQFFLRPQNIPAIAYFCPIIGIVFFILAYLMWKKGTGAYLGTGS